jgi:cobalt/nickel transport system permease protein
LHHVVVERWSRQTSWFHSRDARAKLVFTLALIVVMATTAPDHYAAAALYALVLVGSIVAAGLPLPSIAARAALVLPFSLTFAIANWLAGDAARSAGLLWKSYLSACTVLVLVSTTPLIDLLRALEWFRVPQLVILIAQFLYRYLFVISEQAQHMRLSAQCRGSGKTLSSFRGAAAMLAVLFVRSYNRAEGIQRAMIARGFRGHFPSVNRSRFTYRDLAFIAAAAGVFLTIRFAA